MKKINIFSDTTPFQTKSFISFSNNFLLKKCYSILIIINLFLTVFLLINNNRNNAKIQELLSSNKNIMEKLNQIIRINSTFNYSKIDKDMIGLKYPDIFYEKIKNDYINGEIISSFCEFLNQLEIKLIYLEKEINTTKLFAFYTSRTLFLKKYNVEYDDSKIIEFHNIVSWLIIHKSTQLKGIAADKYLACRYSEMKTGKNLCPHRIGVYDKVDEIDFEKLIIKGNVVLKVSNGCHDSVYIFKGKTIQDIPSLKESMTFHFNREWPLMVPAPHHFYTKKRIILEELFLPITDLYEFKFLIFNNKIRMCILCYIRNSSNLYAFYDENFNSIKDVGIANFNISIFERSRLEEMKTLAIKLSEDFPNFIRVDLYLFHSNIYLSELTFDSHSGMPSYGDIKYFTEGVSKWKRIDY